MGKERAHVNFDDDDQIDLEELTKMTSHPKITKSQKKLLSEEAEKTGFVSRDPIKKRTNRKRSPYVLQKNIKVRIGMSELLADITNAIGAESDQETIEIAIRSLLKDKNCKSLLTRYDQIIAS